MLDNQVYSFPNVNGAISGGSSEITGGFSPEEAKDLANVLKSGKMAAAVTIVQEDVIGPSLGQEAIQNGLISFLVALVLLMAYLIIMYGWTPGLVASFGVICNLFFTMGILASLQAVLTLSGIAGIVLSLAMAVDANEHEVGGCRWLQECFLGDLRLELDFYDYGCNPVDLWNRSYLRFCHDFDYRYRYLVLHGYLYYPSHFRGWFESRTIQ